MDSSGLASGATYSLKLGSTWDKIPSDLIHAVQYDFKPASIDPSQPGQMKIENKDVTLSLPHTDTDESSEFKGSKQPAFKDCFLIVDKSTGTVYLEKVSNMIRVKKHRSIKKKKITNKKEESSTSSPLLSVESPDPPTPPPSTLPSAQKTNSSAVPCLSDKEDQITQPTPPDTFVPNQVKQPNFASSNNLSSESSALESDSSSESDNDDLPHKKPSIDSQQNDDIPSMREPSNVMITPLGEPNIKQEGVASGDALMNMLSQDLDISSDSDSD